MKKNILKKALFFFVCVLCILSVKAQVKGDFRSVSGVDGAWHDTLSWEEFDGSSWVAASWLPGDSNNVSVTIQDNSTIHLKKTPAKAINNLTIGTSSSGNMLIDSAVALITVNGTTTINNGGQLNFTVGTSAKTFTDIIVNPGGSWNNNINSVFTIKGSITSNGTLNAGTAVYTLTGATKTISGDATIYSLTVSGSYTNMGTLTITSALTGTGSLIQGTGSTLTVSGSCSITTLNCSTNTPNLVIYNGTVAQTIRAVAYFNVNFNNVTANSTLNGITTILDTAVITAGATLNVSSGTLTIKGVVMNNGTITANSVSSTIIFQGSQPQTLDGTLNLSQIGNLTINNAAGVEIVPTFQVNKALTLTVGTLSSAGIITLGAGGANAFTYIGTNGNITGTVITNYGTGANNFTYNGTIATTIGDELPASITALTINDSLGVTLNAPVSVTTLNLTKGVLHSGSNLVAVTGTAVASITGGLGNSYIDGPLSRAFPSSIAANQVFAFPVGKSAYQLFELVNPVLNTTGTIIVEAFDGDCGGTAGFALASINRNRYWVATPHYLNLLVSAQVRLTETAPGAATTIGYASASNGTYINIGGLTGSSAAGSTFLSMPVNTDLGAFVLGTGATYTSGVYPVGSSSPLLNLTGLAAILNSITVAGNIVFELQADYDGTSGETFPITFKQFNNTGNYSVTIRPAAGVSARITSGDPGSASSLIVLGGCDRVVFDGRAGGTGASDWIFRNTRITSAIGPTFTFNNDAIGNTLTYLQIEGQDVTAASGTILFSTTAGTTGNDSNTISYCIIRDRSDVTGTPANAIYSVGSTGKENNGNAIMNNNIFNFNTAGISVPATASAGGSGNWIITDNSFYCYSAPTTSQIAINLVPGRFPGNGNHVITGNFIGGSAPLCGGIAWINYGSNASFYGIYLTVDSAVASSVQNNTFSNIDWKGSTSGPVYAIAVIDGSVNIGTVTGNAIGNTAVANSIKLEGTGNFYGIYSSPAVIACKVNIANNMIANVSSSNVATSQVLAGVWADAGVNTITNNTVFNFATESGNIGTGQSSSLVGISDVSNTANQVISHNTIFGFVNNHLSAAVKVTGINYSGATTGTNIISKNNVHNLAAITSSITSQLTGIIAAGGAATYSNNMVSLGVDTAGIALANNPVIAGIDISSGNTANKKFYFNSVYIGGDNTGTGAANTFAFRKNATATIGDTILNNIFMSVRSNATTGGKHYAIFFNAATKTVSNHNVLFVTGNGSVFGSNANVDFASLTTWKSLHLDTSSLSADPAFSNPAGTSNSTDLHISTIMQTCVESMGIPIAGIPDDIDGDLRHPVTPDIGADEGVFIPLAVNEKIKPAEAVILYPNPASEKINVHIEGNKSVYMTIINSVGATLFNSIVNSGEQVVDVSSFAPGIYFVRIEYESEAKVCKFTRQ